ncbi:hypothetical protein EVAR_82653_1 [Eumeta japonica]|uniref:Uncharacterized protein n=1 Tax=Eumeta variegata TaxID=151549 RepID=A0A4C1VAV5_EUMVA|nr:hypothetical protein EVAR_82653_1 [Eumeta japonica]
MLEICPASTAQRATLTAMARDDLLLTTIVERVISNNESWDVVRIFCEKIMSQKEGDEGVKIALCLKSASHKLSAGNMLMCSTIP